MKASIYILLTLVVGITAAPAQGPFKHQAQDEEFFDGESLQNSLRTKRSIKDEEVSQFVPFEEEMLRDDSSYRLKRNPQHDNDDDSEEPRSAPPTHKQSGRGFFMGQAYGVASLGPGYGLVNPYAGGTYAG